MDKKHLKQIKIGGAAFTPAWWNKHASSSVKSAKVDRALKEYQAAGCQEPDSLEYPGAAEQALVVSSLLASALAVASKKCGRFQAETKAGIARYEDERAAQHQVLAKRHAELVDELKTALANSKQRETAFILWYRGTRAIVFAAPTSRQAPLEQRLKRIKQADSSMRRWTELTGLVKAAGVQATFQFDDPVSDGEADALRRLLKKALDPVGFKPRVKTAGEAQEADVDELLQAMRDRLST